MILWPGPAGKSVMQSDQDEMVQGLKMAAVAVVTALVTATVVIGGGGVWMKHAQAQTPAEHSLELTRTSS